MRYLKNILTILFSTLFTLVFLEITFRVFDLGYGNAPLERSEYYHHEHPKNYSFLSHIPTGEYGGFKVYYDERGYRVINSKSSSFIEKDSENSIVFMGDSFTEANQVPYEDTFVHRISNTLKVKTINLGVSSYSPIIYLQQVKKDLQKVKSKIIILQIFRNDFANDVEYQNFAVYSSNEIIRINGGKKNKLISFLRQSYLLRFLRKSQLLIKELIKNRKNMTKAEQINFNDMVFYENNIKEELIKKTSNTIKNIELELKKINEDKQLIVFMIPSGSLSKVGKCCDQDKVYKKFMNEMIKRNIAFIDTSPYFKNYPYQSNLFFKKDIHLTAEGHKIIAKALENEIKKIFNMNKKFSRTY